MRGTGATSGGVGLFTGAAAALMRGGAAFSAGAGCGLAPAVFATLAGACAGGVAVCLLGVGAGSVAGGGLMLLAGGVALAIWGGGLLIGLPGRSAFTLAGLAMTGAVTIKDWLCAALAVVGSLAVIGSRLTVPSLLLILSFSWMRPELTGVLAGVWVVSGLLKLSSTGIVARASNAKPPAMTMRFLICGVRRLSSGVLGADWEGFIGIDILCSKGL